MYYKIGNLIIDSRNNSIARAISAMPEFLPFESKVLGDEQVHMSLTESVRITDFMRHNLTMLYHTSTEELDIYFYRDFQEFYILKAVNDTKVLLMRCHPESSVVEFQGDHTYTLLKYALWVAYGVIGLHFRKVPIHASAVEYDGAAYLFLGESGTGKSTHTRLWINNISGAYLLNDDSPIVSCEIDKVKIYGTPWSGKTPCHRNLYLPAAAFTRLFQARLNEIERLNIAESYAAIHPSMPPAFCYDPYLSKLLTSLESNIISHIPVCCMNCLPNRQAAILSNSFLKCITKSNNA